MSETLLLDANVLIALSFRDHVHYRLVTRWFQNVSSAFATCPITQGALIRHAMRSETNKAGEARKLLEAITSLPDHVFWPDDLSCTELPWRQLSGHRQVTDAYLVTLARHNNGRLATLDQSLAAIFPEALLVSASTA